MPCSRRTLLKTTGLAVSSGTLASIAGCLGDSSDGGSGSGEQSTADPTTSDESTTDQSAKTSPPDFAKWLPDPTKTPLRDGYGILYFDIAGIRDQQDTMHENAYARLKKEMLRPVPSNYIDVADVHTSIKIDFFGGAKLALGSFDPETVGEKFTGSGKSSATTSGSSTTTRATTMQTSTTATGPTWSDPVQYHGFDLYGDSMIYAVSEDVMMKVYPPTNQDGTTGDTVELTKMIIDAATTETSHYVDSNEYVSSMLGVVDNPDALWCYPEAMDGSDSRGFRKDVITGELKSWRFGSETTHLTFADTYPDEETAKNGELANHIESQSRRFGSYDGLDVEVDGLMAWADGTIPTNEFDHLSAGGPSDGVHTTYNSHRSPF
ncbi:hypothetical protein A4G99_13505 [Haladaptatus sp. R4]|uniref:hypothetical protein n=1 Tax=Haladaptatus sp. R4 TaxID=1679489 RepID=UPI0007B4CAAD|nr:hypothetical protein [Haladaptatus sp. R4]KZN23854.1 hypothetical protein A4G99_13505 [Haladaptatus sp. R4]